MKKSSVIFTYIALVIILFVTCGCPSEQPTSNQPEVNTKQIAEDRLRYADEFEQSDSAKEILKNEANK